MLIHLASFAIEEVMPLLIERGDSRAYIVDGKRYQVKFYKSHRYQLFVRERENLVCVACKIPASHFTLDAQKCRHVDEDPKTAHFNLYAVKDGVEILMTKDHIYPRSKGGPNSLYNYQLMCLPCNMRKSDIVREEDQ